MKLIPNAMGLAPGAMLGLEDNLPAAELPGMRELMMRLGAEAVEAGESLGYHAVPILGLDVEDVADPTTLPEVLLEALVAVATPGLLSTSSMDTRKGRKTEAASINGLVAHELERLGKPGSANAAIVEISDRSLRGEREPAITNLDLVQGTLAPQ